MFKKIKTFIPKIIKNKLRYILLIAKIRKAKKSFRSASKEPKWLNQSDLDFLMQKYPIGEIQSYEPSALKNRAKERINEMSKSDCHALACLLLCF